tara:strand:- start:562 stop:939 length:378 start_codon:yes stop_codon:yes gene_type:complete
MLIYSLLGFKILRFKKFVNLRIYLKKILIMTIDSNELKEIELSIADRLYIRIANWNLYLGDAGLAKDLAIECQANLKEGPEVAARKSLESVQVNLGSGNTKIPLARLMPSGQIFDLEEILGPYCR